MVQAAENKHMRFTTTSVIHIASAVLITLMILPGCGNSNRPKSKAGTILLKVDKAMYSLRSFKEICIRKTHISASGSLRNAINPKKLDDSSSLLVEENGVGTSKIASHMVSEHKSYSYEAYALNGYTYEKRNGYWYKRKTLKIRQLEPSVSSTPSPIDIAKLTRGATNIKLARETTTEYKISFDINPLVFKGDSGKQVIRGLHTVYRAVYEVQISTSYVNHATVEVKTTPSSKSGVKQFNGVYATILYDVTITNINQPVPIVLPEDAKSARGTKL